MTKRFEDSAHNAADWAQIERQRTHFLKWEANTALFIDGADRLEENFERVVSFVRSDQVNIHPLNEVRLVKGSYH